MRRSIAAALCAFSLIALSPASPVVAHGNHVGVRIVIGFPGYHLHVKKPVSIASARRHLRKFGYINIRFVKVGSRGNYRFRATRNGRRYLVRVSPRTGLVLGRHRIR